MPSSPDTRPSLLLSLHEEENQRAWDEFPAIYRPVIIRQARHRGMQDNDAEDLAQQVLLAVSRAIERWEVDPERARFRTWLKRVTDSAVLNGLTRGAPDRGSGTISRSGCWNSARPAVIPIPHPCSHFD